MWLFDAIIGFLDFLASLFPNLKDTAEFGRIGKYYAVRRHGWKQRLLRRFPLAFACVTSAGGVPTAEGSRWVMTLETESPQALCAQVESMLVMDPKTGKYLADETPSYGTDTLRAFFEKVAKEGMAGQELGDAAVFGQK